MNIERSDLLIMDDTLLLEETTEILEGSTEPDCEQPRSEVK